jgi:hypothetical protein
MDLNVVQGPSHVSFSLFEDIHKEGERREERGEEGTGRGERWRQEKEEWTM